jgi:hypothetical protein
MDRNSEDPGDPTQAGQAAGILPKNGIHAP